MSKDILVEALWRVTAWGVGERVGKVLGRADDDKPNRPRAGKGVPAGEPVRETTADAGRSEP